MLFFTSGKRKNQNNASCVKCFRINGGLFLPRPLRHGEMWCKILLPLSPAAVAAGGVLVVLIPWEVRSSSPILQSSACFGIILGGVRERRIPEFSWLETDQDVEQWQKCFFLIAWKGRKAQSGLGSASSHVQLVLTGKLCRAFGLRDAQLAWFCRRKMLLALTPSWSSPFNCHRAPRTWSRTVLLLCSGCT